MDLRSNRLARAGAALVLAGGLAGMLAGGSVPSSQVSPPRTPGVEEGSPRNNPYVKLSERYAHVRKVGDLTGYPVCVNPLEGGDWKKSIEESRLYRNVNWSFQAISMGRIPDAEFRYGHFDLTCEGDAGIRNVMGVVDLRGTPEYSVSANERKPVELLVAFSAATGEIPMVLYLTETAAERLEKVRIYREALRNRVAPGVEAVVVQKDSQAERYIQRRECDIGLHNFVSPHPLEGYGFVEGGFKKK